MPNWKKLIVSGSSAELTTLKLTGLSAGTPTTALMLDGSGNVEKRTLGNNAFNSTSFATGDNFDADGTFASLRAQGTTKGDVGLGNVENTALSTYTGENGALDNQYITNGANYVTAGVTLTTAAQPNITSLGTLTSLTVDDITLNGSTISDSGDLTLDIGGDLNIDVDGTDIILKDGGTAFGRFKRDSSDFIIKSEANNEDIIFRGQDGGATIDALLLDMSDAGRATFNNGINAGGTITGATSLTVDDITINGSTISDGGDFTLDVGGDISIDADGGDIILKDGGTIVGTFSMNQNSGDFDIRSRVSNKDLVFKGNDNGSEITALKFDMSDAGKAHFYGDVVISGSGADKLRVEGSGSTIFEVQGSQGQLFSVTDDLTGTIFNVSDISGVPILSVEGDGTVDVDGDLQATALGVGTAAPAITGAIRATNDITAFYSSDKRLKNNITNIEDPLDKLKKINGVSFEWIPKEGIHDHIGKDYGVIAQEIEEVLPELVTTRDNGYKAVKYEKIVALLIETNKQLLSRIEELENKVK